MLIFFMFIFISIFIWQMLISRDIQNKSTILKTNIYIATVYNVNSIMFFYNVPFTKATTQ